MKILIRTLLRAALGVLLAIGFVMLAAAPAHAATETPALISFTLPLPLVLGLVISTILPLLVGLVTKTVTSASVKATLLAGVAALTGLLTEFAAAVDAGRTYDLGTGILLALGAFLVAVGLHFGVYKPTGASEALQRVGTRTTD